MSKSIAFVGGALDSAVGYAHYCASRMDGQYELIGGMFSPSAGMNYKTADQYGGCDTFQSLRELISERPDLVVVLTPTPKHYSSVIELLQSSIPVLCEKALSVSSVEIEDLIAVADDTKTPLHVVYNYSFYPSVLYMRDMVRAGGIGKLLHFQAEMPQEGYLRHGANPQEWRKHDARVPMIYLDLMVHLHQLVYAVTGLLNPLTVMCQHSALSRFDVIDNVTCHAGYNNGVNGQFWFSKTALGERNGLRLRFYGTTGALEWKQENPEQIIYSQADGIRQIIDRGSITSTEQRFKAGHPAGWIEALANLYMNVSRGTLPELYSPHVALAGAIMMETMNQSAIQGTSCRL